MFLTLEYEAFLVKSLWVLQIFQTFSNHTLSFLEKLTHHTPERYDCLLIDIRRVDRATIDNARYGWLSQILIFTEIYSVISLIIIDRVFGYRVYLL